LYLYSKFLLFLLEGSNLATHKSALKRARQNEVRRLHNKAVRTRCRTSVNRVRAAIAEGSPEQAQDNLAEAVASLQKATSKGVLHKNTASRKISRLSRQINRLSQTSS
jgi:small subunit ribosomal protein S20